MSRAFIVAAFVLITTFALCQSAENACWKTATTQLEMNHCANLDANAADGDLNRVYGELLAKLKDDSVATKKLQAAQRAWRVFREARLQELYPAEDKQREHGSTFPMCYAQANVTITKDRTAQLRRMLDDRDPCDLSRK